MIKKIIITLFIFLTLNSSVFWSDCSIWDETWEEITQYINNIDKIIKNITTEISNSDAETNKNTKDGILNMFNKIVSWENYDSYFDYYITFPLSNDISKEVKRDYKLLEKKWEWLTEYLEKIVELWYDEISITNACEWITEECNLFWTASEVTWQLIKNHTKVINVYRLVVMWDITTNDGEYKLQLVDNNSFIDNLIEHYWYWNNCTASDWSFFATIKESIQNINFKNDNYKEWVKEWKDAWALLVWNKTDDEYQQIEKELLKEELGNQWIAWTRAEWVLENLEKYNQSGWFTPDNNFLTNSFWHLKDSITREITEFKKDIFEEFLEDSSTDTIPIHHLLTKDEEFELTENIAKSVSELYNNELPFLYIWDSNTEMIRTDIIDMHNNLTDSINILNELQAVSEKVCNDQSRWEGKCTTN